MTMSVIVIASLP